MDPQQATSAVHAAVPALARAGLRVEALEADCVELRMPLEGNTNHLGTMYAGALFAVAELPGGLLPMVALQGRCLPVVTEVAIRFLRPAPGPVRVRACVPRQRWDELAALAGREGRAEFALDLEVTDEAGQVVAAATGRYLLLPASATPA
jgi:thioesterase domain-containing protein